MIWHRLKSNIRKNNKNLRLAKMFCKQSTITSWCNYEGHVLKLENQYRLYHVQSLIIDAEDRKSECEISIIE